MTHYAPVAAGERTLKPEELTLSQKVGAIFWGVTVPRPQNRHTPEDVGLTYSVERVDVGGGETLEAWYVPHVEQRGVVAMFPGYAESKESLLPAANALHGMGYSLLLVDFRGAGGSSGNSTTLGIRESKDVALVVDYAKQKWPDRPVILYGVSMGSAAVLRAVAEEGVRGDALILDSPFDRLGATVGNRFGAMGLPRWPGAELLVFWGSVQGGYNGFAHNQAEYARSVTSPTLFLYGELDPRVTPEQAGEVYNNLGGRKAFVNFAGAGHESLIGSAPELWEREVSRFLEGVSATP